MTSRTLYMKQTKNDLQKELAKIVYELVNKLQAIENRALQIEREQSSENRRMLQH